MLLFFTIAVIAFMYVALTAVLGHDHGVGHDFSHDLGHDAGHAGHAGQGDRDPAISSILSTKVIAMFLMGFGGAGGAAKSYGQDYFWACLYGIGVGVVLGLAMFYVLQFFADQQSNSLVETRSLIGICGTVEVAVKGQQPGQVAITANERYGTYIARGTSPAVLEKGSTVRVVGVVGSDLIVEQA